MIREFPVGKHQNTRSRTPIAKRNALRRIEKSGKSWERHTDGAFFSSSSCRRLPKALQRKMSLIVVLDRALARH